MVTQTWASVFYQFKNCMKFHDVPGMRESQGPSLSFFCSRDEWAVSDLRVSIFLGQRHPPSSLHKCSSRTQWSICGEIYRKPMAETRRTTYWTRASSHGIGQFGPHPHSSHIWRRSGGHQVGKLLLVTLLKFINGRSFVRSPWGCWGLALKLFLRFISVNGRFLFFLFK